MLKEEQFIQCFEEFGNSWDLSDEMKINLELFVCKLFSSKKKQVNEVRLEIFMEKHTLQNKLIYLSVLPPCQSSLLLHMDRANYVAAMWKRTMHATLDSPEITNHGWNIDGSINWVVDTFPENIIDMILDYQEENNDDSDIETYESDTDSDLEDLEY